MQRPPLRSLLLWGAALVTLTCAWGVAHAASLGGISTARLDAWTYPADIEGVDDVPPTITVTTSPAPNAYGWNNSDVVVSFTCADGESGIASCSDPVTVASEGIDQIIAGTATDNVGNTASASVSLDIDRTGPTVQFSGVVPGQQYSLLPTASCTATDSLSGVNGSCAVTLSPGGGAGAFVATATAQDFAGNTTTATAPFTVLATCGSGPTNVPCVVPPGTTLDKLDWDADVLILGTVTGKVDVDDGSVTVGSTGVVEDDIKQDGPGGVTVESGGFVDGKIDEKGDGSVVVDGEVTKNVDEEDGGDLIIGPGGSVDGHVKEHGDGSLVVNGRVDGDVEEKDDGDLTISSTATVDGDVKEKGDGDLTISTGAIIGGKVTEEGAGSLSISGIVNGDVEEKDDGDLTISTGASVQGKAKEGGAGDMTVQALAIVTEEADSASPGTCTIAFTSVVGSRKG